MRGHPAYPVCPEAPDGLSVCLSVWASLRGEGRRVAGSKGGGSPLAYTWRMLPGSPWVQRPWVGSRWTLPLGWIRRREVFHGQLAGAIRSLVHLLVSVYSFVKWSRCLIYSTNPLKPWDQSSPESLVITLRLRRQRLYHGDLVCAPPEGLMT